MPSSASRALLVVVLLLVAAVGVFLLVGNPFGGKTESLDAAGRDGEAPAELKSADGKATPSALESTDGRLESGAEALGRGDVKIRLLSFPGKKPIVGQAVVVTLRAGETSERKTDEEGRAVFTGLRASRAWTLTIEGPGFAPVEVKGVAVRAKEMNDLGDYVLGEKMVLRGRVIDERGRPIPGAAVSAYTGTGFDMSQGIVLAITTLALDDPLPNDAAQTDEQGFFTLAQLSPGKPYEVHAKHAGHALSVQANLVVSPDRTMGVLTIVLGLGATVRGKVTDEGGKAVAGATVIAMEDMGFGRPQATFKRDYAKTAADGTYVLDTLSRGTRYRFGVSAQGYAPVFDSLQNGLTVEVEATRDFQLRKGGSIEGKVVDKATGQPVADAKVIAVTGAGVGGGMFSRGRGSGGRGPGGSPGGATPGGAPASSADDLASTQIVRTAADGTFRIDGMVPGPVAIAQVKAKGYADYSATMLPQMPGAPAAATPGWGDVRAGETLSVSVSLDAGGAVTGKVLATGPSGTQPVGGAQVAVLAMGTAMFSNAMTGYGTAITGDDGSFRVEGVKAGKYTVTATASGLVAPDAMAAESQFDVPEGGGVVARDVVMSAAGAVEGVVSDTKGRPVGAARVRTRLVQQRGRFGGGSFMRQFLAGGAGSVVLTDADGRYRIPSVGVGEKTAVVADTDESVPSESEPFEVRAGETKEVNLSISGGGTLKGRVIDDHGSAVAGAKLRTGHVDADTDATPTLNAWQTDRLLDQRVSFSDGEGWFEINRLQPGRTLVRVEKEGYTTSYRRDLSIAADEVRDNHVVTLVRGQPISGVVKGEDGKPVAGAMVVVTKQPNPPRFGGGGGDTSTAEPSDGTIEPQLNDRTDADGKFTVEGIAPGPSYTVVVMFANGYRGFSQGDEAAIKRGIPTNARDVEFVLKKLAEGESAFPGFRPAGAAGGGTTTPTIPRPPGAGMGDVPIPPIPGR